jgi:hypothetical protein
MKLTEKIAKGYLPANIDRYQKNNQKYLVVCQPIQLVELSFDSNLLPK